MAEPTLKDKKSFRIDKRVLWEAWRQVRANQGAPGVDEESVAEFERDLKGNLYKLWNRMSSGSYLPPPVKAVQIPKTHGQGSRTLGVPTVADRIAQTVAKLCLEPKVEPHFHPDSYGYRPQRSALDAVGACRERCWKADWVIDLDLRSFFDSVDHELMLRAVAAHTDQRWVLLYVERWLKAPLDDGDANPKARDCGTPQGSAISPLLANLYLHYAFDSWMVREFPAIRFERYADDVVVHCQSERQARFVLGEIKARMASCHLELNTDKTHIVYCKDSNRNGSHEHERFDFLGYTFRPRSALNGQGRAVCQLLPGDLGRSREEDPPNGPALAYPPVERDTHQGHRTTMQPGRARLDQLLRAISPDRAGQVPTAHRCLPGALGGADLQATEAQSKAGQEALGRRVRTRTRALYPLATDACQRRDGGSRMTGDCQVRF